MSKRIEFKVDGIVQGVNFRSFAAKEARKLGVTGFVKNSPDGAVTGQAQGSDDALKKFVSSLSKGPSAAEVTGVEKSEIGTKQSESGFHIDRS